MEHRVLCVGELQTDCYLIWSDPARAIVLDPGDEAEHILRQIRDNGLTVQMAVKDDKLSACGTWSCPEFIDAFTDAMQ